MRFGIVRRSQHAKIADVARAVEDAGFESLWLTEHTHVPVGSMSADEAERRRQLLDPFVALASAAAVTSVLRLGTAVCVLSHREPLVLAKTVASLDLISDGRFLFGVGAGSVPEENLNFGITSRQYGAMLRERIAALKSLWTSRGSGFDGEFVNFGSVLSGPSMIQRPHPPIYIGGSTRRIDDVLDLADGWIPWPPEVAGWDAKETVAEMRRRASDLGRPNPVISIFNAPADREVLRGYADAGIDRCLLDLRSDGFDDIAAELAALRRIAF